MAVGSEVDIDHVAPIKWLLPKNQCQYIVRFERMVKTYGLNLSSQKNIENQALKGNEASHI